MHVVSSLLFPGIYFIIIFLTESIYAALPKTQRGQPLVLGGDPKGKNFLYTYGNSVIIRNIEVSWTFMLFLNIHVLPVESDLILYNYNIIAINK